MSTETKPTPIGRIMLLNARLAFASGIWEATVVGTDPKAKPRFNCGLIIPLDHPQIAEIKAKMLAVAKEKWKDKGAAMYAMLEKSDKLALHDGDMKPTYAGYPGNLFLSPAAQEDAPPLVVDQLKNVLTPKSGKPYSGCYVNASIELWAQDNSFGKRINAQLRGVQFYADGDAFSAGRPADMDEFEELSAGADSTDFV